VGLYARRRLEARAGAALDLEDDAPPPPLPVVFLARFSFGALTSPSSSLVCAVVVCGVVVCAVVVCGVGWWCVRRGEGRRLYLRKPTREKYLSCQVKNFVFLSF
jgi:hypothetical protein